jgi:hypothetical protein
MKPSRRLLASSLIALLLAGSPPAALAQTPAPQPAKPAAPPPATAVTPAVKAEAERHFQRGLELYDEDDFQGARIEFGRAYQVIPNFHVLYNLGQVNFQLQDYAAALRAFEKYLAEGGTTLTRERREEVERNVGKLRARVASLEITAPAGAVITVDGAPAGTAPLGAPIQVSAGRRVVRATLPAREPAERTLELAGGDTARVELTINEPASQEPTSLEPSSSSTSTAWAFWVGTGVLAIGTAVTGVVALTASSSASSIRTNGGSMAGYNDDESRMHTFSLVTDGLGVGTIVAAGLALYFTLASGPKKTGATTAAPHLTLGRGGGTLSLAF